MANETTEPEMLMRFMDAMKQASGSAGQLAHAQQNPAWFKVRDMLEACRAQGMAMATRSPVPRQDVLKMLDRRGRG